MRAATLFGAAVVIGLLALVATAPSSDAATPEWMEPMVEAGRASLLENLDLIEPGSPLALVSAHCRDDGAVRLVYENRWLWVVHRQYFTDAPPAWTSGSMGGGALDGPADWLTGKLLVACSDPRQSRFRDRPGSDDPGAHAEKRWLLDHIIQPCGGNGDDRSA